MSDLFFVINGYMILNIPVLLLELHDHLYLAGRYPADLTNPFKPDLISGLFGYNGTPMLGLFSCFFFIYDLWYFRTKLFKKHKFFFLVYYFLMLAFYLYISILNDNKSFYIFLLFSYGIYFLSIQGNIQKLKEKIRWAGKGIIIALSGSLLVFIVYRFYDPFRSKMDYAVRIITDALEGNFSAGSSDRFAMIHYFFTENINILFGTGFSSMGWKEKMGFGFEHFGQNDLGAFLLIGGVGIVFSLLLILFNVLKEINRSGFLSFLELAFMIFAMLMTQPITGPSITISTMLLFLVCSFGSNNDVSLVFF